MNPQTRESVASLRPCGAELKRNFKNSQLFRIELFQNGDGEPSDSKTAVWRVRRRRKSQMISANQVATIAINMAKIALSIVSRIRRYHSVQVNWFAAVGRRLRWKSILFERPRWLRSEVFRSRVFEDAVVRPSLKQGVRR